MSSTRYSEVAPRKPVEPGQQAVLALLDAQTRVPVEVTFPISLTRPGWENTGFATVWGEVETEHELRAAVTFPDSDDAPDVEWLDKARIQDLGLSQPELEGAEEQAIEAACTVLRKRTDERGAA